VRVATFEVVIRKPQKDALTYEKPLPVELVPFAERNDWYWSIGTAFAIGPNTYVSAGHVMAEGVGGPFGPPSVRDSQGNVYAVDRVLKYSLAEDFTVFTVSGAPPAVSLETSTTPAVDDTVYAVGNALGDGVVIRDGLLTSMTPEDQDGRWKWLRFSAATSPGNSGGPLLNAQGSVVGLVTAKSPNENLNYALPIERVLNASGKKATTGVRQSFELPILRAQTVVTFEDQFDLPLPYAEYSRRYLAAYLSFCRSSQRKLLDSQKDTLFPHGDSAKLLATRHESYEPALVVQQDDQSWISKPAAAGKASICPATATSRPPPLAE
jgi:hypothetical protein